MPLLVDVDPPEFEVEVFVCDVLVELSKSDSGVTVVPTTATLVVVDSGVTVVGIIVVVEDVAAAWGVDEVVELVVVLVLVVDELTFMLADWMEDAPLWPPPCPYPFPPLLEDELPSAFEQTVWTPSPLKNIPIKLVGDVLVPAQAVFKRFVKLSRKPIHFAEQPCPEKSALEQSVRGVL